MICPTYLPKESNSQNKNNYNSYRYKRSPLFELSLRLIEIISKRSDAGGPTIRESCFAPQLYFLDSFERFFDISETSSNLFPLIKRYLS